MSKQLGLPVNLLIDKEISEYGPVIDLLERSAKNQCPFLLSACSDTDCACILTLKPEECQRKFSFVNLRKFTGTDMLLVAITDNNVLQAFRDGKCAKECLVMKQPNPTYCSKGTLMCSVKDAGKEFPLLLALLTQKRAKRPRPTEESPKNTPKQKHVSKKPRLDVPPDSPRTVTIIPSSRTEPIQVDPDELGPAWFDLADNVTPLDVSTPLKQPTEYPMIPNRQEITLISKPYELVRFDFTPFGTKDSIIRVTQTSGPPEFVYLNSTASTNIGFSKFFREPLADDLPTTGMIESIGRIVSPLTSSSSSSDDFPCPVWKSALGMTHDPILGPCHIRRFPPNIQSLDIPLAESGVLFINCPDKAYKWSATVQPHKTRDPKSEVHRLSVWTCPAHLPHTGDAYAQSSNITRIRFDQPRGLIVADDPMYLRITVIPTQGSYVEAILVQGNQKPGPLVTTYENAVADLRQYNMVRRDYDRMRSLENVNGVGSYLTLLAQVGMTDRDGESFGKMLTREQLTYAMFREIRRVTVDDTHITFEMPIPCISTLLQIRKKSGRVYFVCGIYVAYVRVVDITVTDPMFYIYQPTEEDEGYGYWTEYLKHSNTYASNYNNPTLQYTLSSRMAELATDLFGPMVQHRVVDISETRKLRFFLSRSSTEVTRV